ncbi:MAG: Gfo/Idh/MocA family protein [Armatimonadota bacterium]
MPFGVAIAGLDHWYTAFGVCEITASSPDLSLVGISDGNADRREWASTTYPDAVVADSIEPLLACDDVHLVCICAPTAAAPDIARRALAAGKHVVAVKPSAHTLADLDSVIDTAREAGRFFGSFEGMQRLHPKADTLRRLLADGAIGVPLSFHQVGHGGLPSPWPGQPSGAPSWWLDPNAIKTGAWLDHAIYAIDLARYVFGGEVAEIAGHIGNRLHAELPLEDYGIALMRLDTATGPVSLLIEDTWAAEEGGGAHWLRIVGTRGFLRSEGNTWVVSRNGEDVVHPIEDSPFFPMENLAAGLVEGGSLPFGPEDARRNLDACLRFYATASR